ncbi:MAG: glutathione synthase [Rhodospirillaceae bacterium]
MALRVAIQMDHVSSIDIAGDSTFVLALESQTRGHTLLHYEPGDLSYRDSHVRAWAQPLEVRRARGNHFTLGERQQIDLKDDVDVVLMRQDPPFDMAYITATHLLETVHPETLVVNDPREVRNAPEKLFVNQFQQFMPPTLIATSRADILAFREEYKDIIVKPLYGNGGAGVFHLKPGDENLISLLEMFTQIFREPIIVQAYLPDVRQGDKRIILIDGEVAGAVNRVPAEGESRSNMHVGGKPVKSELTGREKDICAALGPELKSRGLIFVGIDVIGGYLTEINVTSPTGLQEIGRFDGVNLESKIWDAIEARL